MNLEMFVLKSIKCTMSRKAFFFWNASDVLRFSILDVRFRDKRPRDYVIDKETSGLVIIRARGFYF